MFQCIEYEDVLAFVKSDPARATAGSLCPTGRVVSGCGGETLDGAGI